MSQYDKDTKFYWLQLKENFFDDDAIQWIEEQKPNGRDYAYFYLKLCLKSLRTNGVLIRNVGKILIPYDNQKLAELTRMDFDTVTIAMELLKRIGLIEILENGEIYIKQIENLVGSKSKGAFKKQQQRYLKEGGQGVDNCPPKCPPKIELDLEKELELELDNNIYGQDEVKNEVKNENDPIEVLDNWEIQFEKFYQRYPKKVKKQMVRKWFEKNKPSNELFSSMMSSLEQFRASKDWQKDGGQFIPYPSTWLNQKRWEDESIQPEEPTNALLRAWNRGG